MSFSCSQIGKQIKCLVAIFMGKDIQIDNEKDGHYLSNLISKHNNNVKFFLLILTI
jgi:hypothetical protein